MIRLGLTSVFFRISTSDLSRVSFLISLHASPLVRHSELKDKNGQRDDPIEGHADTHQPLSVECGRGERSRARVPLTSSSRCQGGASVLFLSLISHSFVCSLDRMLLVWPQKYLTTKKTPTAYLSCIMLKFHEYHILLHTLFFKYNFLSFISFFIFPFFAFKYLNKCVMSVDSKLTICLNKHYRDFVFVCVYICSDKKTKFLYQSLKHLSCFYPAWQNRGRSPCDLLRFISPILFLCLGLPSRKLL